MNINMTKKFQTFITSILIAALLGLTGCATTFSFSDLQITGTAAVATRAALYLIPANHRAVIKHWMFYIASTSRTLSGDPTPEALKTLLLNSIPTNVRAEFPELENNLIPAVVDVYKLLYNQFSYDHTKLLKILNDIATGIEVVASQP